MYIINGQIYIDNQFRKGIIKIEKGKIFLCADNEEIPEEAEVEDAEGKKIVPGFIDIHTHGAVGIDINGASADDLEKIGCFFAKNGTTAWLASVLTDTKEQTVWCIEQYNKYKSEKRRGARLLGIHLEGPFLTTEYKGAMPEHLLLKGNPQLVKEYQTLAEGGIRYITVSPETEGVLEMIPALNEMGIVAAMGHSGADYITSMKAIDCGVSAVTHTGSAMGLLWNQTLTARSFVMADICIPVRYVSSLKQKE